MIFSNADSRNVEKSNLLLFFAVGTNTTCMCIRFQSAGCQSAIGKRAFKFLPVPNLPVSVISPARCLHYSIPTNFASPPDSPRGFSVSSPLPSSWLSEFVGSLRRIPENPPSVQRCAVAAAGTADFGVSFCHRSRRLCPRGRRVSTHAARRRRRRRGWVGK